MSRVVSVTSSIRFDRSQMLRRWAVPVLIVLGLGVADASAQETHFRVLAGASPAG